MVRLPPILSSTNENPNAPAPAATLSTMPNSKISVSVNP